MAKSNEFDGVRKIVMQNPIMQFAKSAIRDDVPLLTDQFSDTAMGAGLGQRFSGLSDNDQKHVLNARRQNLLFGLMRFQMNNTGA